MRNAIAKTLIGFGGIGLAWIYLMYAAQAILEVWTKHGGGHAAFGVVIVSFVPALLVGVWLAEPKG